MIFRASKSSHAGETLREDIIPDVGEVRAFASHLHATGKAWQGELFGWQAEYTPEKRTKPVGSKMPFTEDDPREAPWPGICTSSARWIGRRMRG